MDQSEMATLVEGTRGLQPGRRLFHATNGTLVALALTWLDTPRATVLWILGVILLLLAILDLVRLRVLAVNAFFFRAFKDLVSPREATGVASSTWYALGVLLTVALFPLPAAVSGILVMAWADPAASYIGRRWGRRPFLGGSLEGTLVFLVVAMAVVGIRHGPVPAVVVALLGAAVERRSWPLDDNLAIPVACAAAITLLEALP